MSSVSLFDKTHKWNRFLLFISVVRHHTKNFMNHHRFIVHFVWISYLGVVFRKVCIYPNPYISLIIHANLIFLDAKVFQILIQLFSEIIRNTIMFRSKEHTATLKADSSVKDTKIEGIWEMLSDLSFFYNITVNKGCDSLCSQSPRSCFYYGTLHANFIYYLNASVSINEQIKCTFLWLLMFF